MRSLRETVRGIVLFVFAIIIFLLLMRFLLELIGVRIEFLFDLTRPLLNPFADLLYEVPIGGRGFDVTTAFAIFSYVLLATLLDQIVSAFMRVDIRALLLELFVLVFRLVEYLLIYRIFLKLFGGPDGADLREFTYRLTDPLVGVFENVIRFPVIEMFNGEFDLAGIVTLVIIVLVDLLVELLLTTLLFGDTPPEGSRLVVVRNFIRRPNGTLQQTSQKSFHSVA